MPRRLVALALLVALTSIILVACGSSDTDSPTAVPPTAQAAAPTVAPTTPPPPPPPDGTVVNLQDPGGSGNYQFSPTELTFSVGETVTFTLASETEFHTFTVDDLDIDQIVDAGETVSLTFTFDTPGTFDLICIPHELLGMVGTITVQ